MYMFGFIKYCYILTQKITSNLPKRLFSMLDCKGKVYNSPLNH